MLLCSQAAILQGVLACICQNPETYSAKRIAENGMNSYNSI